MPNITNEESDHDRRLIALRGRARRRGLIVKKSRRVVSADQLGGLMVVDGYRNTLIAGSRFDLTLDEAEACVAEQISRLEAEAAETLAQSTTSVTA